MPRRLVVAGVVVALLAVGAVAFLTGVGPAPGGADAGGSDVGSFPTATPVPSGSETTGASGVRGVTTTGTTGTTTVARPAFAFTIDGVEECGQTCRDVTTTLRNDGDARATDVVVYTRVFVGNGTDGDVVWSGSERVGALPAGESHTATRRVELSYSDGLAVRRADGWITVQTTVVSDQRTVTYAEPRNVT